MKIPLVIQYAKSVNTLIRTVRIESFLRPLLQYPNRRLQKPFTIWYTDSLPEHAQSCHENGYKNSGCKKQIKSNGRTFKPNRTADQCTSNATNYSQEQVHFLPHDCVFVRLFYSYWLLMTARIKNFLFVSTAVCAKSNSLLRNCR